MYQTEIEFDLFYRMSKKVNSLSNCTYVFLYVYVDFEQ